jgi:hypothetical protein
MRDEEIREIAILAIKEEARRKPDEVVYIGRRGFTFSEIASGVENGDPFIIENFLKPFLNTFKKSETFRKKVMELVGRV